jgi:serine/threonine-protein kinase
VERIIGIGGMGVVVAARHLELDHLVAIKFLLPKVAENKDVVGRFTREAKAAVKIQNEHVARVTDVGTLETGAPYMVMEYLEGTDLEDFSRQSGPLSVEECTDFVLQACEAIAEAHALGIVHRDLKPGNLFLVRRPDGSRIVKVLDFGISKITGASNSVAPTTAMLGSPPYMSPEQLTTPRDVDARTDVWSLGVILYRLLTGRVPFDADTIVLLCSVILHGEPSPLREARADVPAALEAVIAKCLEKDRSRRYANVGELARALVEFAPERSRVSLERVLHLTAGRPVFAETVPAKRGRRQSGAEIAPLVPIIETNSSWGQTARGAKQRSRRGLWFVGAAGFLSLTGFASWRLHLLPSSAGPGASATALASTPVAIPTPDRPKTEPVAMPSIPAPIASSSAAPSPEPAPVASLTPAFHPVAKPVPRKPSSTAASVPHQAPEPGGAGWEEQRK